MLLKKLKIGSRRSDLARLQAHLVGEKLGATQFVFKEAPGDVNLKDPLWKMPEMGVFTSFLRRYLISKEIDLVVHSWKDLPVEKDPDSEIVATLPRADPRDLLLVRKSALPSAYASGKMVVLSSSPRRKHNLPDFLLRSIPSCEGGINTIKEIEFRDVRGNIQTRLSKLCAPGESWLEDVTTGEKFQPTALIVAKAAIDRFLFAGKSSQEFKETAIFVQFCLDMCHWQVLPLSVNPTAAAQGALAVEMLDKPETQELRISVNRTLNCKTTFDCVNEERRILKSLGGGCHQKIGCTILQREWGKITFLRGETESNKSPVMDARIDTPCGPLMNGANNEKDIMLVGGKSGLQLFDRVDIPESLQKIEEKKINALYVAKHDALPALFDPEKLKDCHVWTGGVHSWFKLAQRGVWVNGTSDSLGETEPIDIDLIANKHLEWIKLTHSEGHNVEDPKTIATYKLKLKSEILRDQKYVMEKIQGKTHFYFSSGSSFKALVSLVPSLRDKFDQHVFVAGCGPGNTLTFLRSQILDGKNKVIVAYNYADFTRKVLKPK